MPDGSLAELTATFHPCADLFPLMGEVEFSRLVADIKANGLRHPIVEIGNAILDGRNRYKACNAAGVPIKTVKYSGKDPLAYVISANLHRRHLNESQRAMIAQRLETWKHGDNQHTKGDANLRLLRADVATMLQVSQRSVCDAKKVHDRGIPELAQRVEAGEIAVSNAAKVADMPKADQRAVVTLSDMAMRGAVKKTRRAKREVDLAEATEAASEALGTRLYGVIYADPPWRFAPYGEGGMDRAADNHYQTMTTDEICELEVPAADNAAIFMWATAPMLREAFTVLEAWGFTYKSHWIWLKDKAGTGYWGRNKHELLLIGTRGKIPAPAPGEQPESVVAHATDRHSAKPAIFAEMIEEMFPNAALLEMFARAPRAGWDVWGNEAVAA